MYTTVVSTHGFIFHVLQKKNLISLLFTAYCKDFDFPAGISQAQKLKTILATDVVVGIIRCFIARR